MFGLVAFTLCNECGFGADAPSACPVCGTNPSGGQKRAPSNVGWVDAPQKPPPLPGVAMLHAPGRILANRYKVLGHVGRGGMGVVLRAEDLTARKIVALKLLARAGEQDGDLVARFKREVRIAAELKHPNALEVYDAGFIDGVAFYAMEFADGGSIEALIKPNAPLPFEQIETIAHQLCSVLAAAHAMGVVHRDLKPSNVLLTRGGTVKLVDFGVAKLLKQEDLTDLTGTGMMTGTVQYMAPEQLRDSKHVDARADVYAMGVVLFELIAGQRPFRGETSVEIAMKHVNEPAPPLSKLRPGVPLSLERIVARCLEKDPARRFQSIRELGDALLTEDESNKRERMANGDVVVTHPPKARVPLEIYARDVRADWMPGMRLELDERFYRLIDRVEARPPFEVTFRFEAQNDADAVGRPLHYRSFAVAPDEGGLFGKFLKKLKG
ncbi:MAG: protein kinase [Archangium sp.]|nr:protein kinase [Archangium sp.]